MQITDNQANTDWSHPLLQIQFEQLNSNNPPSIKSLKAPVVWNGDIYSLGRDQLNRGSLLKYSIPHNKWSITLVPSEIYTPYSVLTVYLSKLILISGQNGTMWEFDCISNVFKESCIEPVPEPKSQRCVVAGVGKHLVVASEESHSHYSNDCVHIYDGSSWSARHYPSQVPLNSSSTKVYYNITIIGDRTIFMVQFRKSYYDDYHIVTRLFKAPLLLGECVVEDSLSTIEWEEIQVTEIKDWRYSGRTAFFVSHLQSTFSSRFTRNDL